jgi:phosphotransferase system enzyme I (PtsP)
MARAAGRGVIPPAELKVGVMLEVPALLWQLPELLPRVDFISVGTNDLAQFLFAADRGNVRLAERYDPLSPPLVRVLAEIARACRAHRRAVALCGEMAGDPLGAMALIGLGYRNLSMAPAALGPVKAMIRSLDLASLEEFLGTQAARGSGSLRGTLRDFAQDHGVAV